MSDGMVDALEHVRSHERLPGWDAAMRQRIKRILSNGASFEELERVITEWETLNVR